METKTIDAFTASPLDTDEKFLRYQESLAKNTPSLILEMNLAVAERYIANNVDTDFAMERIRQAARYAIKHGNLSDAHKFYLGLID